MTPPARRLITLAIRDLLEDSIPDNARVGIAIAPSDSSNRNEAAPRPYAILYPLFGGEFWGTPLMYPESEAEYHYQVTSVGDRADQVEWMADWVRRVMVGRDSFGMFQYALVVGGLVIQDRRIEPPPGGIDREGMVFSMPETYVIKVGTP